MAAKKKTIKEVLPLYKSGTWDFTKQMTREFDGDIYVGYKFRVTKSLANYEVKLLKGIGYDAKITEPEYITPQGKPVYIVWLKKKDYDHFMNRLNLKERR